MKSWLSLLCVAALATSTLAAQTDQPAPDAKPKKPPAGSSGKTTGTEEKEDTMLKGMPLNQPFYGLRIPNFSPSGKLLMLFNAQAAKRIDDRNVEMKDLQIDIHNDDGTTFRVAMAHSVFNLDTRILTSDTPTKISREDFVINGERAEFHTKNRFGRMVGPSKMIINSETVK